MKRSRKRQKTFPTQHDKFQTFTSLNSANPANSYMNTSNTDLPNPINTVTVNQAVAGATDPKDLIYKIIVSPQEIYNKQEVLNIMSTLLNMVVPSFEEECSYIS